MFETIDHVAKGEVRTKIRDILGAFMFGGEASDRKVKFLSGGERTRLAMIKLLLEPVNLLILDEPTNHLDMRSKDVLKEAIRDFDGTVIVVSHDRQFLDGLVSRVYAFGNGVVREHIGGIYDWLDKLEAAEAPENLAAATQAVRQEAASATASSTPLAGALNYAAQKAAARQQKKLEKALTDAEELVSQLESAIQMLEAKMCTPEGGADMSLYEKHAQLKKQLAQAEAEWESAMEALG